MITYARAAERVGKASFHKSFWRRNVAFFGKGVSVALGVAGPSTLAVNLPKQRPLRLHFVRMVFAS